MGVWGWGQSEKVAQVHAAQLQMQQLKTEKMQDLKAQEDARRAAALERAQAQSDLAHLQVLPTHPLPLPW